MIWHGGLALIWHCMVMGSSIRELKLNFIYIFMVDLGGMGRVRGNPN